ncbi:hypothetical protein M8J76_000750 [Diaphorina citri]|nr:hypothetical protein M8J76_000750 [Diaphorina citri]
MICPDLSQRYESSQSYELVRSRMTADEPKDIDTHDGTVRLKLLDTVNEESTALDTVNEEPTALHIVNEELKIYQTYLLGWAHWVH